MLFRGTMKLKILFIEDNPHDVELIVHAIREGGIEVVHTVVYELDEVKTVLQSESFDMVICDYRLPGFTGLEAVRFIQSVDDDLPVILVSGAVPDETAIEAVLAGAKDYILKDNLTRLVPAIKREYEALSHIEEKKRSEEQYQYLFDKSPNPMLVMRLEDSRILNVNDAACKLYGWPKDEMLKLTGYDLRPESGIAAFDKTKLKRIEQRTEDCSFFKVIHTTREGKPLYVDIQSRLIQVDGTDAELVVINDASDKYNFQDELLKANSVLSTLIDSAPVAVVTLDRNGCVYDVWNKKAEEMFGWTKDEVVGKVMPNVQASKKQEFRDNLEKALNGEINDVMELERVNKAGEVLYIREQVTRIEGADGKVEKFMLLIEDITDRKKIEQALVNSEKKYRTLVEASHDLVWRIDPDGNFDFINKASKEILGYAPEELIGNSFAPLIYGPEVEQAIGIHQAVMRGRTFDHFELKMISKDGEIAVLAAKAYPLKDSSGKIIGCTGTASDITHIKEYQDTLERNLKEKEILIKEIHHRVKNNLAVISGIIGLQTMHLEDEKVRAVFEQSQSRIKSIALIHERLYQTNLFSAIEIKEYLEELVKDIRSTYGSDERNIEISITGKPISLNINQAVPFGILANELITNALKYAFAGKDSGKIIVALDYKDGDIVFEVADDGVGLPDDFEKLKTKSLGMTLVETVTTQLEGTLIWDYKKNKGTTFRITFKPTEMNTWAKKESPATIE